MTPAELKMWRTHWQLSQSKLGALLGVAFQTVNRWETGKFEIPPYLDLALETLDRRLSAELLERAKGPRLQLGNSPEVTVGPA